MFRKSTDKILISNNTFIIFMYNMGTFYYTYVYRIPNLIVLYDMDEK